MGSVTESELSSLTEIQQAILKVLADADGETLRGREVRQRLEENYGIHLTRNGMNAARRSNSRFPNYMEDAEYHRTDEDGVEIKHATHRLKLEYIDTVRSQL